MRIISIIILCLWGMSSAFAQTPVQHEVGIDLGAGVSGILHSDRSVYSSTSNVKWSPSWSLSNTLKYNALLFNKRLNLGVGLGYQRRGFIESGEVDFGNSPPYQYHGEASAETFMLPLEIGYRLPLGEKHSFMADALFIPQYHLIALPFRNDNLTHGGVSLPFENRFSFDAGLKLGYRYQLTDRMSLQTSILGTVEPFKHDVMPQQLYNIQFVVGTRYQF